MQLRRVSIALLIAVASALTSYGLTTARLFEGLFGQLEYTLIDYRTRSAPLVARDSMAVTLVLFDSSTVEEWPYITPYPRAHLATLIDYLAANGAAAIGLDVYLDRLYPVLNVLDSGDVKLRDAIARAGNVVLVGMTTGLDTLRQWKPPIEYFAEHAKAIGTADLPTPFETIRDGAVTVRTEAGLIAGFPLALYAVARGLNLDSLLAATEQKQRLDLPGLPDRYAKFDRDAVQDLPIRFVGPPSRPESEAGAFRAISAFAIKQLADFGAPLPWSVEGKVVILGSGFHDSERFRSPYYEFRDTTVSGDWLGTRSEVYGWTYGAEVHANALQNLLSGEFPKPLGNGWSLLLLCALASAVALLSFQFGAKWGGGAAVLLFGGEFVVAFLVFQDSTVIVPIVAATLSIVLAYLASISYVSVVEGREKRMIKGAFGKYVSPAVVEELVADPSRLKLGGDRRHISILFSDLAGFTSMSEALDPQKLVAVLNQYLDEMSEIVLEEHGTLDKYIGDAIMALYGAPTPLSNHAVHVCRTALRMQHRLEELNRMWLEQDSGWPKLHVRIGINTGDPVVGNIGGEKRFDYTALGDAVNLAARLEPACKTYGVGVIIAEPTRLEAGDAIQVRELDLLAVYGKSEPMRVYELLGMAEAVLAENKREALEHYRLGLETFRRRDFELALQYFRAALDAHPGDTPSALYLARCEEYAIHPPPADWDFVERRQVK